MGYEIDIYGDYKTYIESDFDQRPVARGQDDFQIRWPLGYWEEYARLQAEAWRLSGDPNACIVILLNGKFQVRVKADMFVHSPVVKYVLGPEGSDRLEAWALFVDSISTSPVSELKNLANKALKINIGKVKKVK